MTVTLPPELAPSLREAAERLLAETSPAVRPELETKRSREERNGRPPCHVCRGRGGAMGGHHLVPGDDNSVVPVHARCHRRLHR